MEAMGGGEYLAEQVSVSLQSPRHGIPPAWITTIGGAEAWALHVAASYTISAKEFTSDCLSVVSAMPDADRLGNYAKCPLARMWSLLRSSFLELNAPLTWAPAHMSVEAALDRTKSNGRPVTYKDWRANRLVDGLAKKGALMHRVPSGIRGFAKAAQATAIHALALLGVVTKRRTPILSLAPMGPSLLFATPDQRHGWRALRRLSNARVDPYLR